MELVKMDRQGYKLISLLFILAGIVMSVLIATNPTEDKRTSGKDTTCAPSEFPPFWEGRSMPDHVAEHPPVKAETKMQPTNTKEHPKPETLYSVIEKREYEISYDPDKRKWQSPNRKNGLRSYYSPGKWELKNRVDSIHHNWQLTLRTEGVYADGKLMPAVGQEGAAPKAQKNSLSISNGVYIEQYENTQAGTRQNFIIKNAPKATRKIEVKIALEGVEKVDQRSAGELLLALKTDGGKDKKLKYNDLRVWDAKGKALPAEIKTGSEGGEPIIRLIAEVSDASYPVTIDPIISTGNPGNADDAVHDFQTNAQFGQSVSHAGDVNGDGYSDIIIGAPEYDNGTTDEGAAFIFYGSADGIVNTVEAILDNNQANSRMGNSVAGVGDVNGDGYSDVVVGAYLYTNPQVNEGAIYIYHGSASGISSTPTTTIESDAIFAYFGFNASGAGDVNGDGYSDIIVGAYRFFNDKLNEGAFYIYHGSASGINPIAAIRVEGNVTGARMGYSVAGAGDVNGDGYSDVIAGAPFYANSEAEEGLAFVYHGSASGIGATPATTLEFNVANAHLGFSVSSAGDVNGDGYADVIVGANEYSNAPYDREGAFFVHHGSASGINPTAARMIEGGRNYVRLGAAVSLAGDINGDGYGDVMAAAPIYTNPEALEGAVFVYYGSASGIAATHTAVIENDSFGVNLGDRDGIACAGDVNGDGFSDIIIGDRTYNGGDGTTNEYGIAYVFHGAAGNVSTTATERADGTSGNSEFGNSISNAGDVNGDGYSDVIAGAPGYSSGHTNEGAFYIYHGTTSGMGTAPDLTVQSNLTEALMGYSVSTAGDVNGDGYNDVIAGAPGYSNGETDEGAFYIHYGSASGIGSTPDVTIESNKANAKLGWSVSNAGDVNRDGYGDIIVGAPYYTNGEANEGVFYMYYGSASGIGSAPDATIESNQTGALLGYSVSVAGDVNGDGYSDVIAGAAEYSNGQSNEGLVLVYHGSGNGLVTTPAVTMEGDQANILLGYSVSTAGDVNGDGFSDVIAGAPQFQSNGGAFVYHGSAGGSSATPSGTLTGNFSASFQGAAVSVAGDVNGDGYSDVILGSRNYSSSFSNAGHVAIYYGSASGISAFYTGWEGDESHARLGYSVSGAGDVNGDGFSDVMVGAPFYGASDQGAIYVHHGNDGGGLKRYLRFYNTTSNVPIQQSNVSADNFGVGLFVKSPEGRTKAKLIWETMENGTPFSSGSNGLITNSTQYTDSQTVYTDLGISGTELKQNVDKMLFYTNIRVRVEYDKATSLSGQVYGPWIYPQGFFSHQGMAGTPLPVELLHFMAKVTPQKTVRLDWATASEVNHSHFEVLRSKDAHAWEMIALVPGSTQNSTTHKSYKISDDHPYKGYSYYRLKQIDHNGQHELLPVRSVYVATKNNTIVYPNPSNGVFTVSGIKMEKHLLEQLGLYHATGQDVSHHIQNIRNTGNGLLIHAKGLPKGTYLLTDHHKIFVRVTLVND